MLFPNFKEFLKCRFDIYLVVFMKKIALLIVVLLVAGCTADFRDANVDGLTMTDIDVFDLNNSVDGKVITVQIDVEDSGIAGYLNDISYTKDDRDYRNYFLTDLAPALDWLTENVEEGTIFSWWDYGHMIRGYTGLETVIYSPSSDMLDTLSSGEWDEEKQGDFSPQEKTSDVILAFLNEDEEITKMIMDKYGAEYLLITKNDEAILLFFFEKVGLDKYVDNGEPTGEAFKLTLFKLFTGESEMFDKVYADDYAIIYKIREEGLE
jgi:hypothetical protein